MPQQIEVPGVGILEFPDGMPDAEIANAIQRNFPELHGGAQQMLPADARTEEAKLKQKLSNAAVAPGRSVQRGVQDLAEGVQQLGLEAVNPDAVPDFTQQAQQGRQRFEDQYGGLPGTDLGRAVGNYGPLMAIPGAGQTLPARMAYNAAVGTGIGASQFVGEGESRGENALWGFGAGLLATPIAEGIARAAGKVANLSRGIFKDPQAIATMEAGKKAGVPVLFPDVSQSPLTKKVGMGLEELPLIGMSVNRAAQAQAAQTATTNLSDDLLHKAVRADYRGLKVIQDKAAKGDRNAQRLVQEMTEAGDDVGKIVQTSGNVRAFLVKKIADKKYDKLASLADPKGPVPATQTAKQVDDAIAQIQNSLDPDTGAIKILTNLKEKLQGANFSTLRGFRSEVSKQIDAIYKGTTQGIGAGREDALGAVKQALEDDMANFAKTQGGDIFKAWRGADTYYKSQVVPYTERQLATALKKADADEIYSMFIKRGLESKPQRFYNALDPKGRSAVRYGMVNQAREAATKELDGRIAFSPATFRNKLADIEKSTGVFFKGADKAHIDGYRNLMSTVQRAGQAFERPPTGVRLAGYAAVGGTGALTAVEPISGTVLLTTAAATKFLWTSERGTKFLLAASRYQPGSPEMLRLIEAVSRQVPKATAVAATE
jgi:hypothetical protein